MKLLRNNGRDLRVWVVLLACVLFLLAPSRIIDARLLPFTTVLDVSLVVLVIALRKQLPSVSPFVKPHKVAISAVFASILVVSVWSGASLVSVFWGLLDLFLPALAGLLIATYVIERGYLRRVEQVLGLFALIVALQALATSLVSPNVLAKLGLEVFWSLGASRGFSTFGGPNLTSAILAMAAAWEVCRMRDERSLARLLYQAIIWAALLTTLTRGAWLSAAVGVFVALMGPGLQWKQRAIQAALVLACLVPGLLLVNSGATIHVSQPQTTTTPELPPSGGSALSDRLSLNKSNDVSIYSRLDYIRLSLDLILDSPVQGHGFNSPMPTSYHYLMVTSEPMDHVHNTYLQLAIYLGLPLAVAAGLLSLAPSYLWLRFQSVPASLAVVTLVAAVNGLTDYFLWNPRYAMLYSFLLLVALLAHQQNKGDARPALRVSMEAN